MKKKNEMRWLVLGLLALIVICIILTIVIIVHEIKHEPIKNVEIDSFSYTPVMLADIPPIEQDKELDETKPSSYSFDEIHVLIKNKDGINYKNLYLYSKDPWLINDQMIEAGKIVDIIEYFQRNHISKATITSSNTEGYLYPLETEELNSLRGYKGNFEIYLFNEEAGIDEGVVLINILPVEEYVRFVLPSEMPSYFSFEALKAQAVCARTLAIKQRENEEYQKWNADLDDSTNYQVFNEFGTNEITDLAVLETKGEILINEEEPIDCYYYSTSAGNSNDMSVWENENLPYIKSKYMTDYGNVDYCDESVLLDFLKGSPVCYDMISPFYRWTAIINIADIVDEQYGKVKGFEVTRRCNTGYATEIKVKYESGASLISNEYEIRKFLGNGIEQIQLNDGTVREDFSILPSACFVIEEKNAGQYIIRGGGFGHGIGLSQYGASKMAEDGLNYEAILAFYYENASVENQNNILQN